MTKSAKELAQERLARIEAAINLQEPDRVPLRGVGGDIIPAYAGITQHEFCYDYDKAIKAIEKFLKDFPFDWPSASIPGLDGRAFSIAFAESEHIAPSTTFVTGPMHDVLGDKYYRYPGRETNENATPQFVGGTYMEPDEYDQLIEDPVKFVAETVLPRACNNLATPRQAMITWVRLGIEYNRFASAGRQLGMISAELGYPSIRMGGAYAPLDIIGDFLRGIENVVLDIRRYPDKVKKATEALVEPIVNYGLSYKKLGINLVMIPLHLNEYLSPKLYNEFYWPTLKEVILRLGKEGVKSWVFFEGHHEAHLETILELPKGWGVAYFEKTDVIKAKKVLQGHTCVVGGIPISLIVGGTPAKIDEYVKNLLEQVKPGGGFMLSPTIGTAPADTPLENISALIEAVEKYG
ncbi:uroporphyrinogen decarboxylase family protein [Thermoanaerobacterium sp. DL9XJH110]|uniref:uroporphyrinogen decarboxylase family protein n=1 Tax=Thermoanaerobacterium sp. DL9XJH110 TaxID=3386643 RepID=UPI003BB544E4